MKSLPVEKEKPEVPSVSIYLDCTKFLVWFHQQVRMDNRFYLYKMDHPLRKNQVFLHLQCIYQNISNNRSDFQFHRREFYWEWIWHSLHMMTSSRTMSFQLLAYYLTILLSRRWLDGCIFQCLLSAKDKIDLKKMSDCFNAHRRGGKCQNMKKPEYELNKIQKGQKWKSEIIKFPKKFPQLICLINLTKNA